MESSFKKGYDKTVNADGSFELSFKSERVSAKSASGFALLMIIILFPTSCAVTLPVAHMFSSGDWAQVSKPLWASLALILYIVVLYYITKSKTKISVKPDIGIIINGKNLPFLKKLYPFSGIPTYAISSSLPLITYKLKDLFNGFRKDTK